MDGVCANHGTLEFCAQPCLAVDALRLRRGPWLSQVVRRQEMIRRQQIFPGGPP